MIDKPGKLVPFEYSTEREREYTRHFNRREVSHFVEERVRENSIDLNISVDLDMKLLEFV